MLRIRTTVNNENIFLDLYKNEPVLLSLSFAELQDITKKNSNFSKAFSLPGSKKNNEVFNFFYDLNAIPTTFDPNNKFNSTLMWDGYEIMVGYIRLNGVTITNGEIIYQVTFYNQVGDLMANIGDKFLFDLDLNYLSHPYNPSVILECNLDPNLFLLTGTTNYAYQNGKTMWGLYNIGYEYISANTINSEITPLVQFTAINNSGGTISYNPARGNFDFSGTPVHDYYFKPAIQAKELYEAIVREAGYIVESNFFETAYFQKFYMPLKFVDETIYSRNAIPPCYTYTNTNIPLYEGAPPSYTNPTDNVQCNTLGFTANSTTLTIPSEYQGDYTFRFTFQVTPTVSFCDFDSSIFPNLSFVFTDGISPITILYQNSICDGSLTTVSFDQAFNLSGTSNLSFWFEGEYIDVNNFEFQIIQGPRFIPIGSTINYDIEFPENDYKQIDYITSINKYFNLVVVPNPDKPSNLIIEPIIDYIGKGEVLDWTTKIDFGQTQNLYPTTALLNGTLEYEFKLDQDYANQDFNSQSNRIFGTDKFKLGLEYKDTTTKFSYVFSSPIDITLNNSYVPIITMNSMSKLKQVDVSGVTQQTFVPFKILPKLTFRGLTLPVDNYGFVGGTGTTLGTASCVSGYTINVTDQGWMKWSDCEGIQTYNYFYPGVQYISNGCINPSTVNAGFPFADLASWTVTFTGTPCTTVGAISVYQYWYMDQAQQDRFTNINRFTTYPFNYTGFSHYINFRGEDQSNITPAEFSFVAKDLYNIYYEPYVQDLISEENKLYAAKIYLYPQDIQKLRWNEKILINNTYFRINKITNFNALEPAICDIELVKLTKEYLGHPKLFYDLIPCAGGETKYTNSDIMFNLYAYAGNFVKLYDESLSYLGCYGVTVVDEDPNVNYEKFWLGTAYTSNLVGVYSDCGCTGRTEFDIVQEVPGEDRLFWYSALDCATSATTYTFKSTNADLLTGTTSYKLYNTGTTETVCIFNPRPTFIQATPWQFLSAYTDCAECLFVPPTPTPTVTPTNTPTPSITPTISVTPSLTASPTPTSNPYCYTIQGSTTYYGECFFCPNTYSSFTDWFIRFFDGCNGTQIPAPLNMNVIAHYSDGSTQNTFIPAGGTGDYFIASSDVQCGFQPDCTEFRSPTFEYADVIPVTGSISECCVGPTPTPPPTATPSPTPATTYFYLGRTTPDAGNSANACATYITVRPYTSLKSSLASITVGDRFYDSYPTTPTNGGNNWVALKLSGTGTAYSFQIDTNGFVIQTGGPC
jgi:hypothetical protein